MTSFLEYFNIREYSEEEFQKVSKKVASAKKAFALMRMIHPDFDTWPTEEQTLRTVQKFPWYIRFVKNPDPSLQKIAIDQGMDNLRYLAQPSEEYLEELYQGNREFWKMAEAISIPIQEFLLRKDSSLAGDYSFVSRSKRTTPEIQMKIVEARPSNITQLIQPTLQAQLHVHNRDPNFFLNKWNFDKIKTKDIHSQIQMDIVKDDMEKVAWLKKPTRDVQEYVLQTDRRKFPLIQNPDPDLEEKMRYMSKMGKAGILR